MTEVDLLPYAGGVDMKPGKACTNCKTWKARHEFNRCTGMKDGMQSWCRVCDKSYDKGARRVGLHPNPEKLRAQNKRRNLQKYGMTPADLAVMVDRQGGRCAVCRDEPDHRGLAIDHNHVTGVVRALLCNHCNVALGMLRESAARADALADYIRVHSGTLGHKR